ncbi:MAG TPA: ABC transporter permease [bacterium]|nr:ABC transporter permease [bacterium]
MSTIRSVPIEAPGSAAPSARSTRVRFYRLFRRSRLGMTGAALLAIVVLCALGAPWIARQNPLALDPAVRLHPPGAGHWFGTDDFGRDVFSRVVYGSRLSLEVGSLVVMATAALGILSGIVAGYFRAADGVIMRVVDALLAIPPVLLAIALMAVLGPRVSNVVVSLTIAYVPQLIRVVRSQVLVLREALFAEAAKSAGATDSRIAFLHVLPNAISVVIIQSTVTFADAVLTEAGLSYLGVGEPPGVPSWGNILADGRNYMLEAPWMTVFPGLAIVICVLGLNLLGDGLRDVLDPRTQGR